MEEIEAGAITLAHGLEGDYRSAKFRNRAITILAREAWQEALEHFPTKWTPVRRRKCDTTRT